MNNETHPRYLWVCTNPEGGNCGNMMNVDASLLFELELDENGVSACDFDVEGDSPNTCKRAITSDLVSSYDEEGTQNILGSDFSDNFVGVFTRLINRM